MKRLSIVFVSFVFLNMAVILYLVTRGGITTLSDIVKPLVADTHRQESSFRHPRANVILIGLDALRPDRTTMFGCSRNTTPHLARFAQNAFLFKRAFAVAPWTLPSFMSMFTGMYPSVHGVTNKWKSATEEARLSPAVATLPQILKKNGYALGGFTGDAGVSSKYGFGNDFDVYVDDIRFGGLDHSIPKALDWLRTLDADRPFFMFLHGYDVHGQYDPPAGYTRRFARDYSGKLKGGREEQGQFREAGLQVALKDGSVGEPRIFGMNEADVEFYKALYDEKVADVDERLGQFLAQLKQSGIYDKSIIIVVSDHGEEFLEHGTIDHGQSLYDELTHVLLMIHFPGQTGGRVVEDKVSALDVLPSALDAVGVSLQHKINGVSLLPLLRGEKLPARDAVYAETDYRMFVHKRSVRSDRYKFIYNLVTRKRELYDLVEDPGEHANIVSANSRVAYELEQDLLRWLAAMNTQMESFQSLPRDYIKEF